MNRIASRLRGAEASEEQLNALLEEVYYLNQSSKQLLQEINGIVSQVNQVGAQAASADLRTTERNLRILDNAINTLMQFKAQIQSIDLDRSRLITTAPNFSRNRNITAIFQDIKKNLDIADKSLTAAADNASKLQQQAYYSVKLLKNVDSGKAGLKNQAMNAAGSAAKGMLKKAASSAAATAAKSFVAANAIPIAAVLLIVIFLIIVIVAFVQNPPLDAISCATGDTKNCVKSFTNSAKERMTGETEDSTPTTGTCTNSITNPCPDDV